MAQPVVVALVCSTLVFIHFDQWVPSNSLQQLSVLSVQPFGRPKGTYIRMCCFIIKILSTYRVNKKSRNCRCFEQNFQNFIFIPVILPIPKLKLFYIKYGSDQYCRFDVACKFLTEKSAKILPGRFLEKKLN